MKFITFEEQIEIMRKELEEGKSFKKGYEEGMIKDIKTLMSTLNKTYEEVCKLLKMAPEQIEYFKAKI